MDGSDLFPDGVHPDPLWSYLHPDQNISSEPRTRTEVGIIKYYIIDFGISTYFDDPSAPRRVTGIDGRDNKVPELSDTKPYDPLFVDVFTLGNAYKKLFAVCRSSAIVQEPSTLIPDRNTAILTP